MQNQVITVQRRNEPIFSNLMSEYVKLDDLFAQVKENPEGVGTIVAGEGVSTQQKFMEQLSNYLLADIYINNQLKLHVTNNQPNGGYAITFTYK